MEFVLPLFLLAFAAVLGGFLAKVLKVPPVVGYILAGLGFGTILPSGVKDVARISEIGTILLLFSIGVELSFSKLSKFLKIALIGALAQIIIVAFLIYFFLSYFGVDPISAIILSAGFSLSSTAIVVKILGDRGEIDTIHGGIMVAWLLIQDLAVIPMMVILPVLGGPTSTLMATLVALSKASLTVLATIILGRMIVPYLIHRVANVNSRELLTVSSFALALGTAAITSLFGVSPALGAFLAGVVISESQEQHAVFAETRPLRDLFVALFFVSLGFLISPTVLFSKFWMVILLTILVFIIKTITIFILTTLLGFKGRTAVVNAFGLSQVGEFSFVLFSAAFVLGKIDENILTLGIAVTLFSLVFTPILLTMATPIWRKLKNISPIFSSGEKKLFDESEMTGHIIICGYGRVGSWVGKALSDFKIQFMVVEYNRELAEALKVKGIPVIYGDPAEPEVLESAGIKVAKALILAIPDRVAQENLITYVQTHAPQVKIISRAHQDEDLGKLRALRVDKIVQPEFEAAVSITRTFLASMGKSKDEIATSIKSLRASHGR